MTIPMPRRVSTNVKPFSERRELGANSWRTAFTNGIRGGQSEGFIGEKAEVLSH
jgi:hypothetical protein